MFEMMKKINEAKDIAWKLAHKGEKCNPFLCNHTPSAEEWLPVLLLTLGFALMKIAFIVMQFLNLIPPLREHYLLVVVLVGLLVIAL